MRPSHDETIGQPAPFRLGDWWVEPILNRISRAEQVSRLRPRAMDVLVCLASMPGEVATKQHLIDTVWRTEFVSENALTHVIAELRTELGDNARNPFYIENIPRRGYRLIAEISYPKPDEPGPAGVVRVSGSDRRPGTEEEANPYPGLAAFTADEAEFFFGREVEVARMWRAISSRRLLAVIGPSGVGKSSFLRAGVMSAAPDGWGVVICQPGSSPITGLARVLVPVLSDDHDALTRLVDLRESNEVLAAVSSFRERNDEALLIVDQFEELFTLNTPEEQERFASLLGRLATEADLHIVLGMRDDFVYECYSHEALRPIFSEITPLEQPGAAALRRAVVAPAASLGYSFEDESLVDDMVAEVAQERAALPMLAFAMQRLWDERDTEHRLLTLEASERIGGVTGALARSAEASLESMGAERLPIVRELFRNLVTSKGTRAVRTSEELLSVFEEKQRGAASEVLTQLVDTRLLASYQDSTLEDPGHHLIEIVHESLLSNWPRLVRWQAQDAEGALLRDQLRQATRVWKERGRPSDLLWTGHTFHELQLWRERYPGGLSDDEAQFTAECASHAGRRRRRRTLAVAAAFVLLVTVTAAMGVLWRRSMREARRAEAQKLLVLGQSSLQKDVTAALAYARASLGLVDTQEARRFALQTLWRGPTAFVLQPETGATDYDLAFSPDGAWLAAANGTEEMLLFPDDGNEPEVIHVSKEDGRDWRRVLFDEDGQTLLTWLHRGAEILQWSLVENRAVRSFDVREVGTPFHGVGAQVAHDYLITRPKRRFPLVGEDRKLRMWPLNGGDLVGILELPETDWRFCCLPDLLNRRFVFIRGRGLFVQPLDLSQPARLIGTHHNSTPYSVSFSESGNRAATLDEARKEVFVWSLTDDSRRPERVIQPPLAAGEIPEFDPSGRWMAWAFPIHGEIHLFDFDGPPEAEALIVHLRGTDREARLAFDPDGEWLATSSGTTIEFWALGQFRSRVIPFKEGQMWDIEFTPDGRHLAVRTATRIALVPVDGGGGVRSVADPGGAGFQLAIGPRGRRLFTTAGARIVSLELRGSTLGEPVEVLSSGSGPRYGVGVDPTGRWLATGIGGSASPDEKVLEIIDLDTGNIKTFPVVQEDHTQATGYFDWGVGSLQFAPDGSLYTFSGGGIRRWDLATGTNEVVFTNSGRTQGFLSADGRTLAIALNERHEYPWTDLLAIDTKEGISLPITSHGEGFLAMAVAIGPRGKVLVTGGPDGVVRAGPTTGEEPHLLLGHTENVSAVAISRDGRWLASATDGEIRLWPVPDIDQTPIHTLSRDQLLTTLDELTNLRALRDEASTTGWKLEIGPLPGWRHVPGW